MCFHLPALTFILYLFSVETIVLPVVYNVYPHDIRGGIEQEGHTSLVVGGLYKVFN